jgi:signal transduction histidine kinase/predicted metal-dependent HD superfamily phosphohydrolase
MNYQEAESFVFDYLEQHLSPKLHYHSFDHTRDVMQASVKLCEMEQLSEEQTILVRTAALLHDSGFAKQYQRNEPIGAANAAEWLPRFGYSPEQIESVKELILATDITRQPNGLLQKILRDADLDYIGRHDFFSISQRLREELFEHGKSIKLVEWHLIEKDFLEKHVYYTDSAYRLRNRGKHENLEEIKALLQEAGGLFSKTNTRHPEAQPLPDERRNIVHTLENTSLFQNAEPILLKHVAMAIERIHLKAEEPLFRKGDPGESMYIIEEGTLKVHEGSITFAELGPSEYFGEASLIDNSPRSASVSAATDAIILRIGEKDFYSLLVTYPSINRMLMKELINRLRNQNNAVVSEFRNREQKLQELVELRTRQIVEEKRNVERKSQELEAALKELQDAQHLLIHQEKMASLGQITSGIAHELLNPLNFVNNFSAVSKGLVDELSENTTDEDSQEICRDLNDNLGRIAQHGYRAVEIVRSMAEHSASFGTDKQQVNLRSLLEDAVNVTRKSNGTELPEEVIDFKINITEPIPVVSAVYGDLFRVMINLLRNATLAIADNHAAGNNQPGYVEISCTSDGQTAEVLIRDNGIGIAENDRARVFLPFYTTRAAGKGVGLGLSISHQIVSAYGGTIELMPGQEGTAFRMVIPV